MKEKILEALQTKFDGVDAKILGRIAGKLAKTTENEDAIKDVVNGVTFAQVLENYGDARANDASKTAVANYEKAHNLKDGKPVELPGGAGGEHNEPGGAEDMPAWFKAYQAKQAELEKEINGYKAERTGNARQAKLNDLLKDAPESIRSMYNANFKAMAFDNDEAFTTWADAQKPIIEQLANDYKVKGAVVHQPRGGKTERQPGEADPLVVARAEKVAKAAEAAPSVFLGGAPK